MDDNFVFSYGTLRDPKIQKKIIGRFVQEFPDVLKGFRKSKVVVYGKTYPIIVPDSKGVIKGAILKVSEDELKSIDKYETSAYKRVKVLLESGTEAWVYQK